MSKQNLRRIFVKTAPRWVPPLLVALARSVIEHVLLKHHS
jgi:hypothetical protein